MPWVPINLEDYLVRIEDPDGVLHDEDDKWLSLSSEGDTRPSLIFRIPVEKLKLTVRAMGGWNKVEVYRSEDDVDYEMIYDVVPPLLRDYEFEVSLDYYEYCKVRLIDGDRGEEKLYLYKDAEIYPGTPTPPTPTPTPTIPTPPPPTPTPTTPTPPTPTITPTPSPTITPTPSPTPTPRMMKCLFMRRYYHSLFPRFTEWTLFPRIKCIREVRG